MTQLGSRNYISQEVTKMGSKIGQKIGYDGVGALRGQRHLPSKHLPKYPPPGLLGLKGLKELYVRLSEMVLR